jgi:UDP-N-acetylmuramate dehydrogenase
MINKNSFPTKIEKNVSLSSLTTFGIGGPAKLFCSIHSNEELIRTVVWAKKIKESFLILGGGSNILVSDSGFSGLVIKTKNNKISCQKTKIQVQSGVKLAQLVDWANKNSLSGLEPFWGIPGTIGGAIVGNAGTKDYWINQIVKTVTVLDPQRQIKTLDNQQCRFGYRSSRFQTSQEVVLKASLDLKKEKKDKIAKKQKTFASLRADQPKGKSAGSIFKNPPGLSAGKLIDEVGLKGKKVGQAKISTKHANFIINTGQAKAEDVLTLIRLAQRRVKEKFNLKLEPEIKFIGFAKLEITDII